MLADTVARFVETEYEFEARRKRLNSATGYSDSLWQTLADIGLLALNVPADYGGIGGGPVETMIVAEQFGRGLVMEPFAIACVAAPRLIDQFGSEDQKQRWLPAIADGTARFALAAGEPQARFDLTDIQTIAQASAGGYELSGAKAVVLHGDSAHWLLVPAIVQSTAQGSGEPAMFVVEAGTVGVSCQGFPTIDNQRAAEIRLDKVKVAASQMIGVPGQGHLLLEWTVDQALAALSAESVGVMDKLTELTCEHLRTRSQFGQAIGNFQALSHRAADMRIAVEQARALALMAAAHCDNQDRIQRRRAVSAAKAMAGRSGKYVGQQATHLHGGMGMTDEMACGHYFKRLTAIDMTLGNTEHHVALYGEFL